MNDSDMDTVGTTGRVAARRPPDSLRRSARSHTTNGGEPAPAAREKPREPRESRERKERVGAGTMALADDFARLPLPDDLVDWVGFLRRHWMLMILVWILAMSLVALALYLWPRQYESNAKFLVKNARQELVVGPNDSTGTAAREQLSETVLNTELELLRSRDILARVVRELKLDRGLLEEGVDPAEAAERATRGLSGRLVAGTIRKTNIIQIGYTSRDPQLAATIVQHVADAYLAAHLAAHSSPGTYEMFQRQATDASLGLRQAETELAAMARSSNLVMLDEQKQEALKTVQSVETQLNALAAEAREQATRAQIAGVHMTIVPQRVPTTLRNIPNQSSVERLYTMVVDLRNKRTEALMKFNPTDRIITDLDKQIADTEGALKNARDMSANEESTGINPAWQQLEAEQAKARLQQAGLESKAQELRQELVRQRQRLLEITEAGPQYDELVRNVADAKSRYALFAKRQEEARIADVLDRQRISNVVLAQAPAVSHVPSKPNVRLGVVAGVIFSGVLAVGCAFAREFLSFELSRRRARSREMSVLGISPATAESR